MFSSLPTTTENFQDWSWCKIEPFYNDLQARPINAENVGEWLADWTHIADLIWETYNRLYIAITSNTADVLSEARYEAFLDGILPSFMKAEQALRLKLVASGLVIEGFEVPLRNMRTEIERFREANVPLVSEEMKLDTHYDKISGAQTVQWEGQEKTIQQMVPVYQNHERAKREKAWRMAAARQLADRQALNDLWGRLLALRRQIAANAGMASYRDYRWKQLLRFDYTPEDCFSYHQAVEEVVVPAAQRVYEKHRRLLGLDSLRPWDLEVDPLNRPALHPFTNVAELLDHASTMFHRVDQQLGQYFDQMRRDGLLDVENRKNKAPGAYCADLNYIRKPFIFANAVGLHDDVQTLMHESGHAFHNFESAHLPYHQQLQVGSEIAEVASMSMELLSGPYLLASQGGFYSPADYARARIEHLESLLRFWPYDAVVDAFQHWVYTHPGDASNPAACDEQWSKLWKRFMVGVDWSGLEDIMATGWQRKGHIFQVPFYYIEYGLAQLGAVQIWRNSLKDQAQAVADYRKMLALGGTRPIPDLYQAAGAKFAFDKGTISEAVNLIETTIQSLENI